MASHLASASAFRSTAGDLSIFSNLTMVVEVALKGVVIASAAIGDDSLRHPHATDSGVIAPCAR